MSDKPPTPVPWLKWHKFWRPIIIATFAAMTLMAVETVVINSPIFLIDALFHARELNLHTLERLKPAAREKVIERMCLTLQYYRAGSTTDPYTIPGNEQCKVNNSAH